MARLQESKGRFFLTIAKGLVDQKGWTKGQDLFLIFNERGNIEITETVKKKA
jgi:hypothetical protein